MEEIKCPVCSSSNLSIIETEGNINNGVIIEFTECEDCGNTFEVRARCLEIEVDGKLIM